MSTEQGPSPEPTAPFEIGTRVRVSRHHPHAAWWRKGQRGTVTGTYRDGGEWRAWVLWDDAKLSFGYAADALEVAEE